MDVTDACYGVSWWLMMTNVDSWWFIMMNDGEWCIEWYALPLELTAGGTGNQPELSIWDSW